MVFAAKINAQAALRARLTLSAALLAFTLPALPAHAAANLTPHRAVYDLSLKEASERSGIESMLGRMVYEFGGTACDGYTVSFRFVTEIDTGESVRITDQQTSSYEDIRRHTFDFVTKSYVNRGLDYEVKGTARLGDDAISVEIEKPEEQSLALPQALFPTEHLIELINKARAGETFYESRIFDGSDKADEALITNTVLGEKRKADAADPEIAGIETLALRDYWPVAISYFSDTPTGDGVPVYSIQFKLYADGITRDLMMDYGEFALVGKLSALEVLASEPCDD
ncbi:cell envelope integrity EipB family protein [Pseudohoeflea sp. DP4N28-3]|uniref:Cell envelope integrity EipB family protein n=2 Tax=Pseudohoeflea coraliihabitans TaxID=2860393 RepID=A0ABS6WRB6_9HYPH|nr:cell envelope integrity EipB family protein [Pseudohoeflea sp. DP4N28-3]